MSTQTNEPVVLNGSELSQKRRMPEKLKQFLIKVQGGKFYLPAAYRMVWFRDECPDWGIETQLIEGGQEAGFATLQARIYNAEGRIIASGMKTETRADFPAGWVEKAETGAIARALAVAGFGTQFSQDLDETETGEMRHLADGGAHIATTAPNGKPSRAPIAPVTGLWEGPGLCPTCHAPAGKGHGKPCTYTGADNSPASRAPRSYARQNGARG